MRIAIDCRFAPTHSGLGRYTRELATHLLKRDDLIDYTLFVHSINEQWLKPLESLPTHYSLHTTHSAHYSLNEQWELPRLLRRTNPDLFFSPHFSVPFFCPIPFVVTIHDFILHSYPNKAPLLKQYACRAIVHHAVRKAQGIIAVSNVIKGELCEWYGEQCAKKTTVIHEGVDPIFFPQSEGEQKKVLLNYGIRKPFFLYVGNAKQHKNVQMLIDAFKNLQFQLVLVTGGKEAQSLRHQEGVLRLKNVPDADLPSLYSAAEAFVTASLSEGYCLPIAEAAACGCPVIASNCGAIPEIAPKGSLLIEPTVENLREALRVPPPRIVHSPSRTWEEAARETSAFLIALTLTH